LFLSTEMNYFLTPIIAIVIAIIGLVLFKKLKVLDKPGNDLKNTRKPVPTIQGIFVYIGFFAIIAILFPQYLHNNLFLWLLCGSLPIVIVELLEELNYIGITKRKIHPRIRLLAHILGGILAVYVGQISNQEFIIGSHVYHIPQYLFAGIFVVRSILCINAINRFDGIYSQASWVSSIGFLTIFLLIKYVVFGYYTEFTPENMQILTLTQNFAFILFCISLVSTVIEYKPLGLVRDVGIMFYGFALAYLSVIGGAKIGTLVVALSLVIFDAIRVWLWRIFVMKKNPLKGDYTHLHHRLLWLQWNRREIRAFIRIWSLMMMVLMLLQGTDRFNKVAIFAMMAFIFFGINFYLFVIKKFPCWLPIKK